VKDPGRALQLKSGWYVPAGGRTLAWFRAANDTMSSLNYSGVLFSSSEHSIYECPDVFELDGKIVLLVSTADKPFPGSRGYVKYWVGSMSDDDLKFLPETTGRLDW
jgi:sucrose-6-phosphate hydrolase SacC (GH32 family)